MSQTPPDTICVQPQALILRLPTRDKVVDPEHQQAHPGNEGDDVEYLFQDISVGISSGHGDSTKDGKHCTEDDGGDHEAHERANERTYIVTSHLFSPPFSFPRP